MYLGLIFMFIGMGVLVDVAVSNISRTLIQKNTI